MSGVRRKEWERVEMGGGGVQKERGKVNGAVGEGGCSGGMIACFLFFFSVGFVFVFVFNFFNFIW